MSAMLIENRSPREVGNTDAYNRLQMHRTKQARGSPTTKTGVGLYSDLLRVLIVDGWYDTANMMSMLVDEWGYDVRQAYDGPSGLELAVEYQPDVLLLDTSMPDNSGLELARQVRLQPELADCFMIAVTGRTDAGHRAQCEDAGIDLFLIKPVDPSILQTLLMLESDYVCSLRHDTAMPGEHFIMFRPPMLASLP